MSRTAAVIVTYNRKEKLERCINAVNAQNACTKPDIIVVDNNSSDGTEALFKGRDAVFFEENIHYYNTGSNTGGAGGFCFGIKKAAGTGAENVWLMDDDCVPGSGALSAFLEFDDVHRGEYGFLSSRAVWRDGSLCRMNVQRETLIRNVRDFSRDVIPVTMASFASLFIPIPVIKDIGLPISDFFIWTDDWEYTRRISRRYPCWLLPASVVMHDMDKNMKANIAAADNERADRFRFLYRNDVYLYKREGLEGFAYEAVRLPAHLFRLALSDLGITEKVRRASIIIKGTAEGLHFNPLPDRLGEDDEDTRSIR